MRPSDAAVEGFAEFPAGSDGSSRRPLLFESTGLTTANPPFATGCYGEIRTGSATNQNGYGTYLRDSESDLNYADQRYHSQTLARFLTADPYQASAGPGDPASWNRYGYVQGDPVNLGDPTGLLMAGVVDGGNTFVTTVYARSGGGDVPVDLLMAVFQRGTPRSTGIAIRQSDIWEDMFDVAATALAALARAFAGRLRDGHICPPSHPE